ncbi:surface-adhesin E family protein [Paracidovorax oryzae]|uniref:surface-adhesin E family protein n=1 Tax=Paracidovorax oryzae TaxID=862720 RepID=UPI00385156FC
MTRNFSFWKCSSLRVLLVLSVSLLNMPTANAVGDSKVGPQGDWLLVDSNSRTASYLDATSVEVRGKYVFARSRIASSDVTGVRGFEYRSSITTALYNCLYRSWAPIQTVYFSDTASSVRAGEYRFEDDELAFRFPVARTMGESLMRVACRLAGSDLNK